MSSAGATCRSAARAQTLAATVVLCTMGVTFAVLDAAARNQSLAGWIDRQSQETRRATKGIFSYTGYFVDFEDRLLLDELPAADYSRGGVYLIGSSNLKWATMFWELPPPQQALIHNYALVPAATPNNSNSCGISSNGRICFRRAERKRW